MICLALSAQTHDENRKALDKYRPWIRLAELRVDRLRHDLVADAAAFMNLANAELGIQFILTLRVIADGGAWAHGEDERRASMLAIVRGCQKGVLAYVDLEGGTEWPEVEAAMAELRVGTIRSYHNFSGTPSNLVELVSKLYRGPDEVAKVAVMPRGSADLVSIFRAAEHCRAAGRPFILVGMGAFGTPSRILARRMGCLLSYASSALQGHVPAAPGHMDPQLLAEQFRYYEIQGATRVFGIVGNPVMHSRSPAFHNPRFRAEGVDAVYLHFQVDDLAAFFELASLLGVLGVSVTIPHKEAVIPFLGSADELVHQIKACNTLVRRGNAWHGTNTDAPGFFHPLKDLLSGERRDRAVVVGAGGAARAVLQSLLARGFAVLLVNRSVDRAVAMAAEFDQLYPGMAVAAALPASGAAGPELDELRQSVRRYGQLIVQTTSMGMQGESEGEDPLAFYEFAGDEIVYDIIYTPPQTPVLRRAEAAGCRTLNGLPMFEEQAAIQSRLFIDAIRTH